MKAQSVYLFRGSNGVGGVLGNSHKTALVHKGKRRKNRSPCQVGGMLPGLILRAILAKKRKQNVGKAMADYIKKGTSGRIAIAKSMAQKKVPTPGNTGMSGKRFIMSGLFGLG